MFGHLDRKAISERLMQPDFGSAAIGGKPLRIGLGLDRYRHDQPRAYFEALGYQLHGLRLYLFKGDSGL